MNQSIIDPCEHGCSVSPYNSEKSVKERVCTKVVNHTLNFEVNLSATQADNLDKIKEHLNQIFTLTQGTAINVDYFRQSSNTNSYCA